MKVPVMPMSINSVMRRFLIVCVKRVRTLPESSPVDPQIMKPLVKRLQAAATFAKKVGLVDRDEEARQLWIEVYPKLSEGKPGRIGHVTSRAESQVMRFALIYALMDQSNVIRKEHLEASLALWRYSEASCLYLWGDSVGDPDADKLLSDQTSSRSYGVAWPEPATPEAYYGLPGDIVRAIEPVTESHPIALLTQILLMFGFYCGRQAHFRVSSADRHYSNVFVLLVGPNATARKGASYGRVRAFYEELDDWPAAQGRIKDGWSTSEGLIKAVRDPDADDHHEQIDRRLLALAPQFSALLQVMGRLANTLGSTIRQAWDSGNLQHLDISMRNPGLTATGAHISILGHVTQAHLQKYMDKMT